MTPPKVDEGSIVLGDLFNNAYRKDVGKRWIFAPPVRSVLCALTERTVTCYLYHLCNSAFSTTSVAVCSEIQDGALVPFPSSSVPTLGAGTSFVRSMWTSTSSSRLYRIGPYMLPRICRPIQVKLRGQVICTDIRSREVRRRGILEHSQIGNGVVLSGLATWIKRLYFLYALSPVSVRVVCTTF